MLTLITLNSIFGIAGSFSPNYLVFLVLMCLCGVTSFGFGTVMYCWMIELIGGFPKTIFGILPHFAYATYGLVVALVAYIFPDWHQMELIFSVPLMSYLFLYFILPESPR